MANKDLSVFLLVLWLLIFLWVLGSLRGLFHHLLRHSNGITWDTMYNNYYTECNTECNLSSFKEVIIHFRSTNCFDKIYCFKSRHFPEKIGSYVLITYLNHWQLCQKLQKQQKEYLLFLFFQFHFPDLIPSLCFEP